MTISAEHILAVVGAAVSITTAIFWMSFFLGDYRRQLIALRQDLDKHCNDFAIHIDRRHDRVHP